MTLQVHTIKQARAKEITYFMGSKVRFNGTVNILYGGVFAEAEILEGGRRGQIVDIMVSEVEQEGSK